MTDPLLVRLHRLRQQRGQYLARLADSKGRGHMAEYYRQEAAKLALQITQLEEEIKREANG